MRAVLCTLLAAAIVALPGCASVGGDASGPPVAAPAVKVGDQWTYRARDGFRVGVEWQEVHEVVAAGPDGISVRVTLDGPTVSGSRVETWTAPGSVMSGSLMDIETRRFAVPLQRYAFPMTPGQTWNQWIDDFNEGTRKAGQINRYVRVGGWETVATPAGSFQALRLRVFMRLDDEEFWRGPTQCNYLVWYAPAVGASVREEKSAEYWEKGSNRDGVGAVRAQNTLMQLVAFRRAS